MSTDLNQLFTIVDPKPIPELNREERESRIFDTLVFSEMQVIDPDTASAYQAQRNTRDVETIMRVDILYINRVIELRNAKLMKSSDEVREKAIELSYITDFRQLGEELLKYQQSIIASQNDK